MKKFPLLTASLALMSLSLTQCVVAPIPVESGPATYSTGYTTGYGTGYSSGYYGGGYYGGGYYGGYGATGRVATNAMWAGVTAYGIHERNETRQNISNNRTARVNHAVNHYSRPAGGAYRGGGAGRRR